MKKIVCLFLVSIWLLYGCHSSHTSSNPTAQNTTPSTDTAKKQVTAAALPPADTTIKDGTLVKRYADGIIKEKSNYLSGRRNGECQYFYPNGKLWSDDYFIDGVLDGATASYYENGQKRYEGTFSKGKPTGQWKYYDEKGKLIRTANYRQQANPAM